MNSILLTTSKGLDELLAEEVKTLVPDAQIKSAPGQISFSGTLEQAYNLCLWSRLANRVVWVLAESKFNDAEDLYNVAKAIDWSENLNPNQTLSVAFHGTNRAIKNTQFGAVKIKDAIVDQFVEDCGIRPSVQKFKPDLPIFARCRRDTITIGIDLSGSSLHQRAYRQSTGEAPLKEHVACAILMRSGWSKDPAQPLVDPMCGSGTLAIEAAYIQRNIAPGIKREYWGFSRWKAHDESLWEQLVNAAVNVQKTGLNNIFAADIDQTLVSIARKNADNAGVFTDIQFAHSNATTFCPPVKTTGFLVSNPPYGERLGELTELISLFTAWGQHLKTAWQGWKVSLLSSNRDLLRLLKLKSSKDYAINNGKLECRLVNYNLDEDNCQQYNEGSNNHEFANRLQKNLKRLNKWIKSQDTDCYRIYDADLPDYNVAIDRYGDALVIQEYSPPKTVSEEKAKRRLQEVLMHAPAVCGVPGKDVYLKVREKQKGSQQYNKLSQKGDKRVVHENGAEFLVNLTDYLDTGLFLDHRETRQIVKNKSANKDVLNLFSYTGSVSVFAALGKARSVTTVDMSNTYLEWAKENFKQNNLRGPYAFVQADCVSWLTDHNAQYDLIFIDPPSFSNSKRMNTTWDVQRDHVNLIASAKKCLREGGEIIFSNNRRGFKLAKDEVEALGLHINDISKQTIPTDFARHSNIHQCWILSC
ncbi:bifunctional 23S rRNA (guanine(2069)-N(7))-methyltransferase RlmK/23S rRNA (guanine(2445)-N(2))-methyltransferase RlmL [Alteromonas sp. ASW11-130]|uniref:bifunctional 23S rRNA (guanine(2069)-N(7))-methyltransferase RlmK/23S rRNA (guanine(2445)-N(2))-methyltransferase RlmL n=1 Tax=Alteromonas sp. ASW11-130 TaxID=3015775 RepID=UPI002242269D|nr:bifunctional 23S rRNA (guanine(2069)-N(7))-methyltransferase RlmK/23S rRNA (guanine(2445)-N(2))-methyltransferase RlmL [Alteromonas sp. ASW11-130]MCW8092302.1 bifunctional 23S rRNA (guanine(2069)-N(7))-methyltransferase RlmK/23S rRNA (guanine(2445)-N(2))-methyltransferase RlmL [Alteromonas sp. ASW11-130]